MTLWASRDGQKVTIHGNNGLDVKVQDSRVQEFGVTEDAQHVQHFWGQLGELLEQAKQERAAAATLAAEGEVV
jgi:hypothetical protein